METFGIRIYKEYFNFAAAHFLIFQDGTREELHGHNYHVQMALEGALGEGSDIFIDFMHIKPIVRDICGSIDHRMILPTGNPHLTVETRGNNIHARYDTGDEWMFPARDCLILPIPNTSAERLAQYLCAETLKKLAALYPTALLKMIEFSVEESRGQAAVYRQSYPEPQRLRDLVDTPTAQPA